MMADAREKSGKPSVQFFKHMIRAELMKRK
jgi:hypothetical protein